MADAHETIADIIAEMLGARTEFPFVYLIGEPDTPEVIDFSTKEIIKPRKINIRRVTVNELADRLKAALKRERGNSAKLREALRACLDFIMRLDRAFNPFMQNLLENAIAKAEAALAAPHRNCDKFPNADRAELEYRAFCERMGIDSSIYGAMAWMLANDTDKLEGGNTNGDK